MLESRIAACLACKSGEEEQLWCEVSKEVKAAAYCGESETMYLGVLVDNSEQDPEMVKGTFVTLTMRGWKEPLISAFS